MVRGWLRWVWRRGVSPYVLRDARDAMRFGAFVQGQLEALSDSDLVNLLIARGAIDLQAEAQRQIGEKLQQKGVKQDTVSDYGATISRLNDKLRRSPDSVRHQSLRLAHALQRYEQLVEQEGLDATGLIRFYARLAKHIGACSARDFTQREGIFTPNEVTYMTLYFFPTDPPPPPEIRIQDVVNTYVPRGTYGHPQWTIIADDLGLVCTRSLPAFDDHRDGILCTRPFAEEWLRHHPAEG
ncbi:hypothetical protein SAMN05216526_1628 [Ectothiorhodosinus mongolicus]|uniref:Uncharacterized protein n=1 Tax=Ectothiorhodosinus mongolicus TaxID=233100 RepID=A0A1R3W3Q8_9GAMM|nr:hypothetical protein SAMN05216526_1628 [Ectothiorhodosinus mongolicus]